MRDHNAPSGCLGHVACLDTLSDGTDLVDLKQKGVAEFLVDSSLDSGWIGDQQVISDNLDFISDHGSHLGVGLEVILIEWVLDRNNWVSINQLLVELDGLVLAQNSIVLTGLLTKVVSFFNWIIKL